MASRYSLQIQGLPEFEKALAVLPSRWAEAERVWQKLAAKSIMVRARDLAKTAVVGNGVYRLAAKDVKAIGLGTVQYGGKPYDLGAEYGSYAYHQFPAWRGNGEDAGYFFWPAVREFSNDEMMQEYLTEVWQTVRAAFPDYH